MTTAPPPLLGEQRQKLRQIEAHLERERAILDGMERLYQAMQSAPRMAHQTVREAMAQDGDRPTRRSSGRQPGAISKRWRLVLSKVAGRVFNPTDIALAVRELEQRVVRLHDARRQMEKYAELGFVTALGDDRFELTEAAIDKFDLKNPEAIAGEAEESADVLQNENEPPSGVTTGGSDARGWGVPPPPPSNWTNLSHPPGSTS